MNRKAPWVRPANLDDYDARWFCHTCWLSYAVPDLARDCEAKHLAIPEELHRAG